jgi:hypothetical protein
MAGTPLPLGGCRGANSVIAGDLSGSGEQAIVVACAESRTLMLFERRRDGGFVTSSIAVKGGWGAVTVARLTHDRSNEIITANAEDGTITLYFPN